MNRRSFLNASVASLPLTVSGQTPQPDAAPQAPRLRGYILGPDEGEIILVRNTKVIVKVAPQAGSRGMAAGTQQLPPGASIPVHKHEADEMLVVQKGAVLAILGDQRRLVTAGSIVFAPKGAWHGVEPTEEDSVLLWVVSPPGLEEYFRETGRRPGDPIKRLTPRELEDIARKHGTVFRRAP